MRSTFRRVVLLALFVSIAAYGCGGSSEQTASAPPPTQTATAPTSASPASAAEGKKLFQQTCAACHGMEGQGVPNLGKDMTTSAFIKKLSDAELVAFIKQGRMPGDPANTTGVAMPPKGGNPALQDGQLQAIVAYIRTLMK